MPAKTLYLVAGNGGHSCWWRDTVPLFKNYQAEALRLVGFENQSKPSSLDELAKDVLKKTQKGQHIFAVGVMSLVILRAAQLQPQHFEKIILYSPVGAFLGFRPFVKMMSNPLIRKLLYWVLCKRPHLLKRKFTTQHWSKDIWDRIKKGYRECNVFEDFFDWVRPDNALLHYEWIEDRIQIIWGSQDAILDSSQQSAWAGILPRAKLSFSVARSWAHYPYLDNPAGFVHDLEAGLTEHRVHTKSFRLELCQKANAPVPSFVRCESAESPVLSAFLEDQPTDRYFAIRSVYCQEDGPDQSNAGQFLSVIRVAKSDVLGKVKQLFAQRADEVIVQIFIEPQVSGVAFVREVSIEVDWVEGHLHGFLAGKQQPQHFVHSKLGAPWAQNESGWQTFGARVPWHKFYNRMQSIRRAFHFQALDIEWAWDGETLWILQARPVTRHSWRRCLTSANLDEILPKQVSHLLEVAQVRSRNAISKLYGLWDARVLQDNENFTEEYLGASYINMDFFLSCFYRWGLPSTLISKEIGGRFPNTGFNFFRFIQSTPIFGAMLFRSRKFLISEAHRLFEYERDLNEILNCHQDSSSRETQLQRWFVEYYTFIVRYNFLISACASTALFSLRKVNVVYGELVGHEHPHRLAFESDPATLRQPGYQASLQSFPHWPAWVKFIHQAGLPGLRSYYLQLREWFRDNNMRLFYRLYFELKDSRLFKLHPFPRTLSGTFWQNAGEIGQIDRQDAGFVIYPGEAEGRVGTQILIEEFLDPGKLELYARADAVIADQGGRLSHGSILLRELRKPSAVVPGCLGLQKGQKVRFKDGKLEVV